jgi:hypothetical protein
MGGTSAGLHAQNPLALGKNLRYSLDRRLDRPQSLSGRCGEQKRSCLCRESNPDSLDIQPVTRHYTD